MKRGFVTFHLIVVLAVLAGIVALGLAVNNWIAGVEQRGYDRGKADTTTAYEKRIAEQKKEAAAKLAAALKEKDSTERELRGAKDKLERDYAKARDRIDEQVRISRNLIAASGGLRDPGAGAGRGASGERAASGDSAGAAGATGHERGTRLSAEASEFLLGEAASANKVVARLQICRAWVERITGTHGAVRNAAP